MRILIVHNRYRTGAPSGENRVVDTEAQSLAALGHDVVLFERHSDEIGQWPPLRKAVLPARIIWNQDSYRSLKSAVREHHPDVVHVHNTFPLISPSALYACREAGVPVVATLHNYKLACANGAFFRDGAVCHDCASGQVVKGVRHGCYRGSVAATVPVALTTAIHRRSWRSLVSAYILISESQRDLLSGVGLPAERVFVRYNLIPNRDRSPVARTSTVAYAGRLDEPKGVRLLMAGWDSYLAKSGQPGLGLVIAGGGPLGAEVAAWAKTRPSVTMAGTLSGDRCAELIARARAVLLPSAWEETFGLVAVEAMAAGTPPVATRHGSFTELITHGTDGVLFDPGDPAALGLAITDVEADPERYALYGDRARQTYEQRFDPQRGMEELLKIYHFAITHCMTKDTSHPLIPDKEI